MLGPQAQSHNVGVRLYGILSCGYGRGDLDERMLLGRLFLCEGKEGRGITVAVTSGVAA